ncbi:MAG: hypothetical protein Q4G59_08800 [Planctomycetia bacterium]|nr:hypothetical protein [Planctomycetia bacterium]
METERVPFFHPCAILLPISLSLSIRVEGEQKSLFDKENDNLKPKSRLFKYTDAVQTVKTRSFCSAPRAALTSFLTEAVAVVIMNG